MRRNIFDSCIKEHKFRDLFIELDWNNSRGSVLIDIDEQSFTFDLVAEMRGFRVITCQVDVMPATAFCKRIDTKLRPSAQDYILIFYHPESEHQKWVIPVRNTDKRDLVTIEYETAAKADFLYNKLEGLNFSRQRNLTLPDVKASVQCVFAVNSEKITKDFFREFKAEHKAFLSMITGLDDHIADKDNRNKDWYTSVMLNRLMFCYFIQKKGFLDGNVNYLHEKLKWVQGSGRDQFFGTFYKGFLCSLFHDGLNSPRQQPGFREKYGRIPYLNGGMFDEHQLEKEYEGIDIKDEAFERLFRFFDKWEWHLDTRLTSSGKDINPDVLGYIFEQYINDRAAMGAYYTKEDITEYIGKNCILPFLMDKLKNACEKDFLPGGYVWKLLCESGDRYIYDAVKKGHSANWQQQIPDYIYKGVDTAAPNLLERRARWNEKTFDEFALPTEIWRETVERLQRCDSLLAKISGGEIAEINDFITYNLDIRQFVYDLLQNAIDPKFVKAFYTALQSVTILDPTCGSGAFLFAAMNILEPLYEVCLDRMEEWNKKDPALFKTELDEINKKYRSNRQYFIFKSIILRNLYGVDIMVEATEIAKLRLFLKMVAVVEVNMRTDNMGLDPLPDIDFNIRCGNTLVGYANEKELEMDLNNGMDIFANTEFREKIEIEMEKTAMTYNQFRAVQLHQEEDMLAFKNAKKQLRERLSALNDILNRRLYSAIVEGGATYEDWKVSHQPFHWLAEFYDIIHGNGGFDVIIGNPPYVEYNKKDKETKLAISDIYKVRDYKTEECGNLYAFCMERSKQILSSRSLFGMIVPLSLTCGDRMEKLRSVLAVSYSNRYYTNYEIFPSKLFDGAFQRVTIFIGNNNSEGAFVTKLHRWYSIERDVLFGKICYTEADRLYKDNGIAKLYTKVHSSVIKCIYNSKNIGQLLTKTSSKRLIYYQEATNYWMKACMRTPYYKKNEIIEKPAHGRYLYFTEDNSWKSVFALINSSLFYLFYSAFSDGFHLTDGMVKTFPFSEMKDVESLLHTLADELESDIKANSFVTTRNTKNDNIELESFKLNVSKPIIDEIDKVLAKHYGFTEEELDFIINYDIKYRMGDNLNEEE